MGGFPFFNHGGVRRLYGMWCVQLTSVGERVPRPWPRAALALAAAGLLPPGTAALALKMVLSFLF